MTGADPGDQLITDRLNPDPTWTFFWSSNKRSNGKKVIQQYKYGTFLLDFFESFDK
jgi:hypothetical protein